MTQDGLNNKEKDLRGVKKQAAELLECAWLKGYVAGFNDAEQTFKRKISIDGEMRGDKND